MIVKQIAKSMIALERFLRLEKIVTQYKTYRLKRSLKLCGVAFSPLHPVIVEHPELVQCGSHVRIAPFTHIWGGGGVTIGSYVMIGSHTAITSETHDPSADVMFESHLVGPVRIENNVWIGAHVSVLPNVTIGEGSVVGAGSVVNKDIPPNAIAVGVPAKVLRYRNQP